ncbi:sensor histidine kinase [Enterococcus sp. HY326]|uniref:sensor histidine kinase n=1 Tax=Enterococcus sp. HY326 TaxID=2971265 RepID=UPI0022409EC1|nr:HAMP domain-containing sensor histidine kinase [Enterococcus sp. HY326]
MATTRSFKQLVRHTYWKIFKQSLINILFFYFLPLAFTSFSNITERNIQSFSIFFNVFSGVYLSIIIIATIVKNVLELLKTIKTEMDAVYEQSSWFDESSATINKTELTLTEFIETKQHIETMQQKIKNMLEDEKQQKQELMFQVSAAAHDLKTPLTVIKGNAEFLQASETTLQEKQCLSDIEGASIRLNDYFEQFIQYSKTFYDMENELQACSISELIEILEQEIHYTTQKKAIFTIDSHVDETIIIRINLNLVIRALLNLATNALHYSNEETPTIRLTINSTKEKLCISLWNSDSEFSQRLLNNVGQLFYQDDTARNPESNHYGIGLAFVQRVARLHQGNIKLSNRSNGANVDIFLAI